MNNTLLRLNHLESKIKEGQYNPTELMLMDNLIEFVLKKENLNGMNQNDIVKYLFMGWNIYNNLSQ
jgi:hypothetical protein